MASPLKYSFNAGELSDLIDGRVDQPKYGNGLKIARNVLATVQGPMKRRGGTGMVSEVKQSADRTWTGKFKFNVSQSYILEFGDFYVRFFTSHAQVLSGMAAYEIVSPWAIADLTDAVEKTFTLSFVQSNDVIYIACAKGTYPLQKLQRFGNTNWSIVPVDLLNGPFQDNNINKAITIVASTDTGGVTLTATGGTPFNANLVGSLFYLEEAQNGSIPPWEAGKAVALNDRRRSDSKTYIAQGAGTTGSNKLIHTEGIASDGTVSWLYSDPGYGWVKLTGFTSSSIMTGTVVSRLPYSITTAGASNTYRWAKSVFSVDAGFPETVCFFSERLVITKGIRVLMSSPADFENFIKKEFGTITANCAINISISGADKIKWAVEGNDLLVGTAAAEYKIGTITTTDPFGPGNCEQKIQTNYGSRGIKPIVIGESTIFAQASGRKVRDVAYSIDVDKYRGKDLIVLSEHLTKGGIIAMDYQQEPYSVIWVVTGRGKLLSFTYNTEQDVLAWMPHPVGGNGFVESVQCIPAPDQSRDEVWLIVRRTINGVTKRYHEYLKPEFDSAEMRQQDCFYVDAGLSLYNNINAMLTVPAGALVKDAVNVPFAAGASVFAPSDIGREIHYDYVVATYIDMDYIDVPYKAVAEITGYVDAQNVTATINKAFPAAMNIPANGWRKTVIGLGGFTHLIGQKVDILVDGASHPQMTVDGSGNITPLQYQGSVIHAGLPCPMKFKTMRAEVASQAGTSQTKMKRAQGLGIRFKDTLGGRVGVRDSGPFNDLLFRAPSVPMNEAPPLFNGDMPVKMPEGYDTDGYIIYENDQPFPVTVICLVHDIQSSPSG